MIDAARAYGVRASTTSASPMNTNSFGWKIEGRGDPPLASRQAALTSANVGMPQSRTPFFEFVSTEAITEMVSVEPN
jgi:hypothetical protein